MRYYKENFHVDEMAGAERVNIFEKKWLVFSSFCQVTFISHELPSKKCYITYLMTSDVILQG